MKLKGPALRLTIFIGEFDKWPRKLDELVTEGMVVVDEVEVTRYLGREHEGNVS